MSGPAGRGCPVAAGLFEFDDVDGPVSDCILTMKREWRGLLTRLVHEAVARGHPPTLRYIGI
jgi:hypothetical protein